MNKWKPVRSPETMQMKLNELLQLPVDWLPLADFDIRRSNNHWKIVDGWTDVGINADVNASECESDHLKCQSKPQIKHNSDHETDRCPRKWEPAIRSNFLNESIKKIYQWIRNLFNKINKNEVKSAYLRVVNAKRRRPKLWLWKTDNHVKQQTWSRQQMRTNYQDLWTWISHPDIFLSVGILGTVDRWRFRWQ